MIVFVEDLTAALSRFHPKARIIPDTISVYSASPASSCVVSGFNTVELQELKSSLKAAIEDCDNLKDQLQESRMELDDLKARIAKLIK